MEKAKKCSKCGAQLSPLMTTYSKGICENCEQIAELMKSPNVSSWLCATDFY